MDILTNLRAFLATARYGSFTEAARHLHVVPSVITKRINDLEQTIGTQLFNRSTRQVVLTEPGNRFQSRASALVADFDDVISSLKRHEGGLEGHIRLKAPTTLTMLYLADVLNAFQREHKRITMDVVLMDRSVNPIEESFDIAIGARAASYEGVIDIPLCPLNQVVCAAPAYLERCGAPLHPRSLADHDCLVFKPSGPIWLFDTERGPISIDVPQRLTANDNYVLYAAALAGNGIAILPTYVAKDALAAGTLQPLLRDFPLQATWLKALIPKRRQGLPRIDALVSWLTRHLGEVPPWEKS